MRRNPNPPADERFLANIRVMPSGCIEWQGCRMGAGYGVLGIAGRLVLAHRYALERAGIVVPAGRLVCHRCDNPPCVNRDHLFVGTHADNNRDAMTKGHTRRGEHHPNAKLSAADVEQIRTLRGHMSGAEIGRQYGVSDSEISLIFRGERWR